MSKPPVDLPKTLSHNAPIKLCCYETGLITLNVTLDSLTLSPKGMLKAQITASSTGRQVKQIIVSLRCEAVQILKKNGLSKYEPVKKFNLFKQKFTSSQLAFESSISEHLPMVDGLCLLDLNGQTF